MQISKCKIGLVSVTGIIGVVFLAASQNIHSIIKSQAFKKAILTEGSEAVETFVGPPVSIYQKIYMFNLTNVDDVRNGSKPIVEEKGPYVFRIEATKDDLMWNDDRTELSFTARKSFFFEKLLSNGSLDDRITTVNPIILTAVRMSGCDEPTDSFCNRSIFFTETVGALLYDGFVENLFDSDEMSDVPNNDGRPGYLIGKNGTAEGNYTVKTGSDDVSQINNIIQYKSLSTVESLLRYFDNPPESIRGTNGERFPPFVSGPPSTLTLFNPLLCKSWDLAYSGQVSVNDLECSRYSGVRGFLSPSLNKTLNIEYGEDDKMTENEGTFFTIRCQESSSPVFYSLPHFLNAESELAKQVEGLKPDPDKHAFYLDIFPNLGFVVNMKVRVQASFQLKGTGIEPNILDIKYPIFWQEMTLLDDGVKEATGIIKSKLINLTRIAFGVSLGVGIIGIILSQVLLFSSCFAKKDDDDDDYAFTPNVAYNARDRSVRYN